jgi:H+-transporting ATPase
MSHAILDLCTRNKTDEQVRLLNADVDEFAQRGLRALAVAIEDVPNGEVEGQGNGFALVGLLIVHLNLVKNNFSLKINKFNKMK